MRIWLVMVIAVSLVLGVGFMAGGAPKSSQPAPSQSVSNVGTSPATGTPLCPCPSGWHRVGPCGQYYTCKPKTPKPVACPEGAEWQYNENQCSAGCYAPPPK